MPGICDPSKKTREILIIHLSEMLKNCLVLLFLSLSHVLFFSAVFFVLSTVDALLTARTVCRSNAVFYLRFLMHRASLVRNLVLASQIFIGSLIDFCNFCRPMPIAPPGGLSLV